MRKTFKSAMAGFLALLMLFSLCTDALAYETPGDWGENVVISFDEASGTLTLGGQGKLPDTTKNSGWFSEYADNDEVLHVVISDEITRIGNYRFSGLPNLQSVDFGGVKEIGTQCFSKCPNLSDIDISTLDSVGDSAFWQCTSLKTVTLPETIGFNCFGESGIETIDFGDCTAISKQAFNYCQNIVNLTIPDTIESIGVNAFYMCSNLENLYLNEGLKSIGSKAFLADLKLTLLCMPDSVTSIAEDAFTDSVTIYHNDTPTTDHAISLNLSDGSIEMDYATDGRYAFLQGENITISSVNDVTITTTEETENQIYITNGTFDVTLDNVKMVLETADKWTCISVKNQSVLNLSLLGNNVIDNSDRGDCTGSSAIVGAENSTINIDGSGSLLVKAGGYWADGIYTKGTVVINTGTIESHGAPASAGIHCKTLQINGGTSSFYGGVGGYGGAGIGCVAGQTVTINGGVVNAYGTTYGAGIGGELATGCGTVIIDNATVTAQGGREGTTYGGADIGNGDGGDDGGIIFIGKNATVNAKYIGSYGYWAMDEHECAKYGCSSVTVEDMSSLPEDVVIIEKIKLYSLQNVEGNVGDNAEFKLKAESHTSLTYQWQRSDDQTAWEDIPDANSSKLSVEVSTGVYYRCKVTNDRGHYLYSTAAYCNIIGTGNTYTVNHYRQKEDGTYLLIDSELHYATAGTEVTATAKTLKGFYFSSEKSTATGTVAEDNSLVLSLYYDISATDTRSLEYVINSMTIRDSNRVQRQYIPTGKIYVEVNVTNLSSTHTDYLAIASYSEQGQMLDITFLYFTPSIGQNYTLGTMFDNTQNTIGEFRAFIIPISGTMVPLSNSVSFD